MHCTISGSAIICMHDLTCNPLYFKASFFFVRNFISVVRCTVSKTLHWWWACGNTTPSKTSSWARCTSLRPPSGEASSTTKHEWWRNGTRLKQHLPSWHPGKGEESRLGSQTPLFINTVEWNYSHTNLLDSLCMHHCFSQPITDISPVSIHPGVRMIVYNYKPSILLNWPFSLYKICIDITKLMIASTCIDFLKTTTAHKELHLTNKLTIKKSWCQHRSSILNKFDSNDVIFCFSSKQHCRVGG